MTAILPSNLLAIPFAIRNAVIVFPDPDGPKIAHLRNNWVRSAFLKAIHSPLLLVMYKSDY
jgi:hypothetical protein